jgi:hypothetical protein
MQHTALAKLQIEKKLQVVRPFEKRNALYFQKLLCIHRRKILTTNKKVH